LIKKYKINKINTRSDNNGAKRNVSCRSFRKN
jgi:hypothetical protein